MPKIPSLHAVLQGWLLDGPLAAYVPAYVERLERGRYASSTSRRCLNAVAHFAHWMSLCRLPVDRLDESRIDQFLQDHLPHCGCRGPVMRRPREVHAALMPLLAFLRQRGVIVDLPKPSGPIAEELSRYDAYMLDTRGLASGTRSVRLRIIERLLVHKFAGRPLNLQELQPQDVRRFVAEQLELRNTISNAVTINAALRGYLRWRATCGDSVQALLGVHGTEIFAAASAKGVMVAFEAAVAGGIPIIKALREGLTANRIQWLAGIINGTTNFILSEMRSKGLDFDVVLKEAQRLGYAEADPTFDIEGVDAAHKVTLMSAIAFGIPVQFDKAYVEGITKLGAADIKYAEQLGYRIKLLGITKRADKGIELRVHPSLVPSKRLIANVEGAMNAVVVQGDAVGTTLYYGKGAGSEPTASAVIADLVDIARLHTADPEHRVPHLAFQSNTLQGAMDQLPVLPMSEVVTSYYLRLRVADQAGVLAKVTGLLAEAGVSIDAVLQREADEVGGEGSTQTDLIILTHDTREGTMDAVIAQMQALPTVLAPITRIRKEELN